MFIPQDATVLSESIQLFCSFGRMLEDGRVVHEVVWWCLFVAYESHSMSPHRDRVVVNAALLAVLELDGIVLAHRLILEQPPFVSHAYVGSKLTRRLILSNVTI